MKKITNEQLNILGKIIAEEVLRRLPAIKRIECPNTFSGKHHWTTDNNGRKYCEFCDFYSNF